MFRRRRFATTALIALAVLLGACGAPIVAPPGPTVVSGSIVSAGPTALGTGLVFFDVAVITSSGVAASAILQLEPGTFVGPLTSVDGGQFTIELPDGADLPAAALSPPAAAFYNLDGVADCDVVADVPAALISDFAVGFGALPGAYAVTAEGGFTLGYVADAVIDFDAPTEAEMLGGLTQYGWIYASEAVTLSIEGTGCDAAINVGVAGTVALEAGWNQVAWDMNADLTWATLRADDSTTGLIMNVRALP